MGRYASERMAPTAEQISGAWGSRILRPQNITVCQMSSLLLILSTFFDDNGCAGSTLKILSNCNCVLLKDCWIWWLVLVAEDSVDDCPRESRLPSKLPASLIRHPNGFSPFSICLRSFIPDLSFYLAAGMDRIN